MQQVGSKFEHNNKKWLETVVKCLNYLGSNITYDEKKMRWK